MEIINSTQQLKKNFLEIFKEIAPEDTQALLDYRKSVILEKKIKKYCTKEFPMDRVLLVFHSYASIAYITAELKVNAKIYLDYNKKDFMLLSYKKNSNPDTCSVVFSTIQKLCNYPFFPIPVKEIFDFIENENTVEGLSGYFEKFAK